MDKKPTIFTQRGHAVGTVAPSGMAHTPMRDISNCLPHIMNNAIIITQQGISTDEQMDHLNCITIALANMYAASRQDNTNWITGFKELYEYLNTYTEAAEVYGNLCANMVLNIFSYLFTSTQMGFKTGETMEPEDSAKIMFTSLLSAMDDKVKSEVNRALQLFGNTHIVPDLTTLLGSSKEYIKDTKEAMKEQEERSGKSS